MINWSQIVELHGPKVWKTAYCLLNNEADAADCFQSTFVAALKLARREAVRHWPALLKRLATMAALDCLRQRHRAINHLTLVSENDPVDRKEIEPAQFAQAGELAEDLRSALAKLDARQAQVFCLACLEDMTYQEIAEQIDVTANHVGVLLNRAKASLRELLRAHDPSAAGEHIKREVQP
jgi:RNA polymerase sigma-70 factor (ECF subfamily)